jgi:hypothetical protein
MPIKNRQIDVEVLSEMRFAPCDATLIADDTCDRATEPGFRRKPEANKLSERPQVAQSPARGRSSTSFQSSPAAFGQSIIFFRSETAAGASRDS